MRGRLAIGHDHDDGFRVRMLRDVPAREHECVLQVGALHHVPGQTGKLGGRQSAGVVGEADDLDRVLRVLRRHQRMQGQRGCLGGAPRAAQCHRVRQVDEQCDRGARPLLGLDDFEVVDGQMHPAIGRSLSQHGVAHRAHDVNRLFVAEPPAAAGAGQLTGRTGVVLVVVTTPTSLDHREDPAQRGRAEPAYRPWCQLETSGVTSDVALPLQLAFDLPQLAEIGNSLATQCALDGLVVDVVERGAGVVLTERRLQVLEVGELFQRRSRVTETERCVAAHPLATRPVQVGSPRTQCVAESAHLMCEAHVFHGRGHQRRQLVALLRRQGREHAPGRGCAPSECVDELLQVLRVLREEVAVVLHELAERLARVLTTRIGVEHVVEVREHVLDTLHVFG